MKKHLLIAVLGLLAVSVLPACSNTVHGAGEDIERAGEKVQSTVPPKN